MGIISMLADSQAGPEFFEVRTFIDNDKDKAFHGFFGRNGGVSHDIYASLNCGRGSNDDPAYVSQNLERVADAVGTLPDHVMTMYQVHGKECHILQEKWPLSDRPQCDGVVTDKAGFALGILTADCAPVLFYGEKPDGQPVIGAAHAGWKGAVGGILGSTLDQMQSLGAVREEIKACIGPCISARSYEVADAFATPFLEEDTQNERFFKDGRREGKKHFDLPGYCAAKLYKEGLTRVFVKDLDTYFNEEDFFSYRRTTHRGDKDYGRQISVIMIKPD